MSTLRNISIMTVFLPRENIFFLEEWLNYHILIGFTHFYLYTNMGSRQVEYGNNPELNSINEPGENVYAALAHKSNAQVQQDLDRMLAPYAAAGYVTQIHWQPRDQEGNITLGMGEAYTHYIQEFSGDTDWTAITNLDEFIVPVKHGTIQDLVGFCETAGFTYITLPQKCFGPRFDANDRPVPEVLRITDSVDWVTSAFGRKGFIRSDTLAPPPQGRNFHVHAPHVDEKRSRRVEDATLIRFNHYKFNQQQVDWVSRYVRKGFQLNQQDESMAAIADRVRAFIPGPTAMPKPATICSSSGATTISLSPIACTPVSNASIRPSVSSKPTGPGSGTTAR